MSIISLKRMGSSKKAQRGASIFGMAMLLALIGLFLLSALKIAPVYLDNNVIVNAMEGLANNNDLRVMSVGEIRNALGRSLRTNNVSLDLNDVVLNREGNNEYIDINYESRVPLFYNIEVVVTFENRFDKN